MIFKNRQHAGQKLADELMEYAGSDDVVVLGIPRGGVAVASEIARALHAPLDVFLSRKLGVPGQEELAFGAVADGGGRFLDRGIVRAAEISPEEIEAVTRATMKKLQERARLYRNGHRPVPIEGKTVILVDDGIATGASIYAALRALRSMKPRRLIAAAPVASRSTYNWLRQYADGLIVPFIPENFYAVGQFYEEFPQVSDREVLTLLQRQACAMPEKESAAADCPDPTPDPSATHHQYLREVNLGMEGISLAGTLSVPAAAKGIVLFAHGSGSSRYSARNRYVAGILHAEGIATLLFDLLTREEEEVDRNTLRFRFDIELLSERLIKATQWITENPATKGLKLAYFGASTGAAAAFVAAASLPGLITAVVSRGGRPDLAGSALPKVNAASLLIVGSLDTQVLALNRQALAKLGCRNKQLVVIGGATHLFEEPACLEQVAQISADWIARSFEDVLSGKKSAMQMQETTQNASAV